MPEFKIRMTENPKRKEGSGDDLSVGKGKRMDHFGRAQGIVNGLWLNGWL